MEILPFRGYRYAARPGSDLSAVVAPPYDQIDPGTQARLYALGPHNVVRATLPRETPGRDRYHDAAATLDAWLAAGLWRPEATPALYPYHQVYAVAGRTITRRGFVALGAATEYAQGQVRPHERTHAGPKRDRLALLEATRADLGLLFMLVSDPAGELLAATEPEGAPIAEARDLRGEHHRLWRITDPGQVERVQALMAPRRGIIADGHHRYETAVAYARSHPQARMKLMAFFTLEAPGLTILPNHRLVRDLPGFTLASLLDGARAWFEVHPIAEPLAFRPDARTIGVVSRDAAAALRLRPDRADAIPWPAGTSTAWRALAVSLLHEGILGPWLGITAEHLDRRSHVDYVADQAEAVRRARAGECQAAFLIAPTTPAELLAVVEEGELMPQKSTHFYPKLLDGLVFHRLATGPAPSAR